ncbi:hypothetical protein GTW59_29795 [Streptomyces sp. SID89]|nr:hypothetical protein [Streptomyces sp. SID89]
MVRGLAVAPARDRGGFRHASVRRRGFPFRHASVHRRGFRFRRAPAPRRAPAAAPLGPPPFRPARRGGAVLVATAHRERLQLLVKYREFGLVRDHRQRFGRSAAPRAEEGAVEVPSARVAVVHDAGRLDSAPPAFLGAAVKVPWGIERAIERFAETVICRPH